MRNSLLISTCGLLLMALGCSSTDTSAARMTDDDVENAIETRLDANAALRAADLDVDADLGQNEITLSGDVESEALREQALEIARDVQPAARIVDKIDVEPREVPLAEYTEDMATEAREKARSTGDEVGDSLEDAWIHTKIKSKLIGDSDTPGLSINVDVKDHTVVLRGEVEDATAKQEAERIAKDTEGVTKVTNRLVVKG